jgi:hypothetical protein
MVNGTRKGVGGQRHGPAALYPRERPGTHCTGGWVGPLGRSGQVRKISPPPEFDSRTVQPVASRYTHYATPSTVSIVYLAYIEKCYNEFYLF